MKYREWMPGLEQFLMGSLPYREVIGGAHCSYWITETSVISIMLTATLCIKENSSRDQTRKHKVKTEAKAVDEELWSLQWREHS